MRSSFQRLLAATLLSCALFTPALNVRAQQTRQQQDDPRDSQQQDGQQQQDNQQQPATRPRRATTSSWPTTTTSEPVPVAEIEPQAVTIDREPVVRIGLVTNARAVNVSTDGPALKATDSAEQPLPLEVARVRVEPRAYPALTAPSDDADTPPGGTSGGTEAASSSASAPKSAKESKPATAAASSPRPVAPSRPGVQLTARASAPTRGEALYAPGTSKPLLDLRAPVVFAPVDPELHPVRYNEKPYRGRLEVFANSRGSLTVVNVISLEDYVRGVVPNELSPGGWPQLEALKAQAVAARTYAVSNLGRFAAEGFDLTPDTRSQVYGGRATEHPLTDRAVAETRGRIATYKGVPINALYTSTCGGRTEDGENIFGGNLVPYLRGRECALESGSHFAPLAVRTTREPPNVKAAEHATSARDAALLAVHGFNIPARIGDEWLAAGVTSDEVRDLLNRVAILAHQPAPFVSAEVSRPGGFATALAAALDGESRGAALLNSADVEYLLAFRDASEVPQQNRADVAAMLREGHLALFPDGTLRPRLPLSRARVLQSLAHALEGRGLIRLQKATARMGTNGGLVLRPASGKDLTPVVSPDAFLFRAFGEALFAARELELVGGEPLTYHTKPGGEVDYIEARPAASGAASDHVSPFANWAETLTPSGVLSRLSRSIPEVGSLIDLRVRRRGVSGRVLDLEVVGTSGTAHVRGGRIRSALGLREQLFVIDRVYDEGGRVARYTFTGRGWGHGVGMCQVGAYGLARAGLSYDKILKSFYTGISVTKLY
ncbi:MAG TPA: SpoIID/LytB domain-containing protein [Pyrinomonadaceae bacterium]|nr:SpoIID/LytB domain-containing protein [Pyrinomonadaceae bacterium]